MRYARLNGSEWHNRKITVMATQTKITVPIVKPADIQVPTPPGTGIGKKPHDRPTPPMEGVKTSR